MTDAAPILELVQVGIAGETDAVTSNIDLILRRGELAVVYGADDETARMLADVTQGLFEPAEGTVRFLGRSWGELSASRANSMREWIGRISPTFGWLSNLDLEENVTLGQRHQTRRPVWEIRAEARRWAQAFGLHDGLPRGRPAEMAPAVLHRAACVRAFLGDPRLIVVEIPSVGDWIALHRPLIDACSFLRGRGAAIFWLAGGPHAEKHAELRPTVALDLGARASSPAL